jgi:hypothetical protein
VLTDDGMGAPLSLLLFLFFRLVNVTVVFIAAPHFPLVRSHFAFLKSVYLFNLKKKTIAHQPRVYNIFFLFISPPIVCPFCLAAHFPRRRISATVCFHQSDISRIISTSHLPTRPLSFSGEMN